jgi:hypothetical protein
MVTTERLERLLQEWAERVVRLVGEAGAELPPDGVLAGVAGRVAQTSARDAAARVVSAVVAAVIIQRARKSTVATVASRVAPAQLVEGYPVNVFHLCVSD